MVVFTVFLTLIPPKHTMYFTHFCSIETYHIIITRNILLFHYFSLSYWGSRMHCIVPHNTTSLTYFLQLHNTYTLLRIVACNSCKNVRYHCHLSLLQEYIHNSNTTTNHTTVTSNKTMHVIADTLRNHEPLTTTLPASHSHHNRYQY